MKHLKRISCCTSWVVVIILFSQPFQAAACGFQKFPSQSPGKIKNWLYAVSADAASDAWAVGQGIDPSKPNEVDLDIIEHWNGAAWSMSSTCCSGGYPTAWLGVSARSFSDAWAVGYYSNNQDPTSSADTMAAHWNGIGWTSVPTPSQGEPATLRAVVDISRTDAWAVGDANGLGLIENWNGSQWSVVQDPQQSNGPQKLYAVAAIGRSNVWAVGSYTTNGMLATEVEHFDGTSWSVAIDFPYYGFFAIAAAPPDNVYVPGTCCGYNFAVERFDGTNWTLQPGPPFDSSAIVNAAAADGRNDAMAVGSDNSSPAGILAALWNGESWVAESAPPNKYSPEELLGVTNIPNTHQFWGVGDVYNTRRTLIELYHC
jgi:hypothetical protein